MNIDMGKQPDKQPPRSRKPAGRARPEPAGAATKPAARPARQAAPKAVSKPAAKPAAAGRKARAGAPAVPVAAPAPDKAAATDAALLQVEDEFYRVLAGGTKVTMLLTVLDTGLAQLLHERGPLTEEEIFTALGLHRGRGHKLMLLLESLGLLTPDGATPPRYQAADVVRVLVDPAAPNHFFYRDFVRYWRIAAYKDHVALLHGAKVLDPVRYPPVLWEDVVLLHDWMRDGALVTLGAIERKVDFGRYQRVLDVAGGDATMAVALCRRHPHLQVTVFNLPAAAALCRRNIAAAKLGERIKVVEGDFRIDSFPVSAPSGAQGGSKAPRGGYDLVQFSRVMADWDTDVCRMLMQKAHAVLKPGGNLLIAEPLRDDNPDLSVVWEHSYLPYDDFGAYVYKLRAAYDSLLQETGFRLVAAHGRDRTIHSVLLAEKI